jgi:hypothetical protein
MKPTRFYIGHFKVATIEAAQYGGYIATVAGLMVWAKNYGKAYELVKGMYPACGPFVSLN